MKRLQVNIQDNNDNFYDILIGSGHCKEALVEYIGEQKYKTCILLTNRTVDHVLAHSVRDMFPKDVRLVNIIIEDGEKFKTLETASFILDQMFEAGIMRDDCMFCLGGGVIGDIGGFVASIYLRGIKFVHLPTTVLSMVDSCVGGKTGVNHTYAKNSIGTFTQPDMVIIDSEFLTMLPKRQLISGFSEIIKHSLIQDADLFDSFEGMEAFDFESFVEDFNDILYRSCRIKADIVEFDEKEKGMRMLLNFGHTFGHMIETLTSYSVYTHGEAIFAGMEFATYISHKEGEISREDFKRVQKVLLKSGILIELPKVPINIIESIVSKDKKNRAKGIHFIYLERLGKAFVKETSVEKIVKEFVDFVNEESKLICFAGK